MAKRRAKRPLASNNRFDSEALGMVLVALGVFLIVTVVAVPQGDGVMARLHRDLQGGLGWASYVLPALPICYGVLVFLSRELGPLTRRALGVALIVVALLGLQQVFWPGEAGRLAALAVTPLTRAVGWAAALPLVVLLTLGIETVLGWPSLTLARGFVRGVGGGSLAVMGASRDALASRREGQGLVRVRSKVRHDLSAHLRDLQALEKLYPQAKELRGWHLETREALKGLGRLDEPALKAAGKELAGWRELSGGFVASAARDLRAGVAAETPECGPALEATAQEVRAGRHDLSAELPATLASAALDRVRRALVMDLFRLSGRAGTLERERVRSEKALEKADPAVLTREAPLHRTRTREWADLSERAAEWRARAGLWTGWPELSPGFDRAPAELAAELAGAVQLDPEGTLRDRDRWAARLDAALAAAPAKSDAAPALQPTTLNLDFSWATPQGDDEEDDLYGDVPAFTPNTPGGAATATLIARPAVRVGKPAPWEDEEPDAPARPAIPSQGAIDIARPGLDLLDPVPAGALSAAATHSLEASARARADLINQTLSHFGLSGKVVDYARGPTVTRYEIEPAPGEKISRIATLANDLARALAVGGVRVEAPVPGKSVIGLEVPNAEREPVTFHTAAAHPTFKATRAKLPIILGKSIDGEMVVGDLARMPHLLIAGSTGSGKSVCVNTLITSLLYKYLPTELRFLMVDPKMVELTPYDGIPHLVRGVVTNPADAAGVLLGAVAHMERRYKMMSQVGAKNLEQFNAKMRLTGDTELPQLVIIIDELADLMITSPKEVESAIMRLAQMARATGMHLVLATQRPSVDILTSLIKVNVPARVAFAVSSSHDSRTILDSMGAERLTGSGDMLFYQPGLVKPMRLQGPYISETESVRITEYLRRQVFEDQFVEDYGADFEGLISSDGGSGASKKDMDFSDPLLRQAAEICIEEAQGSVSRLQRRLSVGHARAGKLMDLLEAMGIVSKHQGSKPRDVLITQADLPEYFGR